MVYKYMIKPSPRTLAIALIVVAGLPILSLAQAETDYEARLTEAKGEVTVFTADEPEGVPGGAGMPLLPGDKVKTGEDGSAEIALSGEHCISLRSRSELTLSNLRRADSELSLALGSLLAKVQSLAGGLFRVRTPSAVAAVRGGRTIDTEAERTAARLKKELQEVSHKITRPGAPRSRPSKWLYRAGRIYDQLASCGLGLPVAVEAPKAPAPAPQAVEKPAQEEPAVDPVKAGTAELDRMGKEMQSEIDKRR